ncbi:hypothetical protein CP532_1496 [Ophiocordyceps camponoti-leonardi (nom. inval.)]|nr:hypothetical protein CP532_1496 [Ophiocordyceps camponoti-leonardi (nom. inval.)]
MSIPPQLIRVKRKRDDEVPVTFLQFDEAHKRHRVNSNWAYRRRDATSPTHPRPPVPVEKPVIHTSPPRRRRKPSPARPPAPPPPSSPAGSAELRRFHISRSVPSANKNAALRAGVSKQGGAVPAVFVERGQNRVRRGKKPAASQDAMDIDCEQKEAAPSRVQTQDLKRAGVANKAARLSEERRTHAPLPASLMNRDKHDMDQITADMNKWVLDEIGASLKRDEAERRELKFRPKAAAQRYHERHAEAKDLVMNDASDGEDDEGDDDGDWIIEEYVRIPANSVAMDVLPSDIGVLVLRDDDENLLFFGSQDDDEDEAEDDEDENAENHYTADYPEDEVESDDEYDIRPYGYRISAVSDDEEFDQVGCSDDDVVLDSEDDDEAKMERIRAYMKHHRSTFG